MHEQSIPALNAVYQRIISLTALVIRVDGMKSERLWYVTLLAATLIGFSVVAMSVIGGTVLQITEATMRKWERNQHG